MIELVKSGVAFNEERHTYSLNGKELHGITNMLRRQLFPDEYANVPESTLRRAAERGTAVHQSIELYDSGFMASVQSAELASYIRIKDDNGLATVCNEYTVSDGEYFASNIDIVMTDKENKVYLVDVKSTYTPNIEYVRWQLSVYAYLFELQNPELKVGGLRVLWLRGEKSLFKDVARIDVDVVKDLLLCEREGRQFKNPFTAYPAEILDAQKMLADIELRLKEATEQKKKAMSGILEMMRKYDIKSFKGTSIHLIRKAAGTRESVDTARLKEEHPEIYHQYLKITKTSESLTLKLL